MMKLGSLIASMFFLNGCVMSGASPEAIRAAERRELTVPEKTSLSASLAQTLKDPGSAQFKWMPIIVLDREGINDYCGLVNSRNSYGGYVGFQKFYAQLYRSQQGEFLRGEVRLIASDNVGINATNGACDRYGYSNMADAR